MDCLKDLKSAQDGYNGRLDKFEDRLTTIQKELKESDNNNKFTEQKEANESAENKAAKDN